MEIQVAAHGVVLKFSGAVVAVNPPVGMKKALTPSIILNTYPVPVSGRTAVYTAGEGQRVFSGSGEYEKDGVAVRGFCSAAVHGKKELRTTSWYVRGDDLPVLVLGDVSGKKDLQELFSEIPDVAVLVVPCFGGDTLSAAAVADIAVSLRAKRVVLVGSDDAAKKKIAKEVGSIEEVKGKYVLKKKGLLDAAVRTVLLEE